MSESMIESKCNDADREKRQTAAAASSVEGATDLPLSLRPFLLLQGTTACGEDEQPEATSRGVLLDLSNRSVSPETVACLADFAANLNTDLIRLSLSKNALGPKSLQLLGKALVANNTIQFLELDSCELLGNPYRPQMDGLLALSKGIQSVRSCLRYLKYVGSESALCAATTFNPRAAVCFSGSGVPSHVDRIEHLQRHAESLRRQEWVPGALVPVAVHAHAMLARHLGQSTPEAVVPSAAQMRPA
ncbi:hypothetical protein FI667_g788, partial [Globisporangium splendens]